MNCQQINELIYDYCDGKVTPEMAGAIEKHLHECPFCRNNEKLTRMENEALYDQENSQILLPGFTEKVMAAINSGYYNHNQGLINKWIGFNRLHKYIPTIAIMAIILLVIAAGSFSDNNILNISSNSQIADNGKQIKSLNKEKVNQALKESDSDSTLSLNLPEQASNLTDRGNLPVKITLKSAAEEKNTQAPAAIYKDSAPISVLDQETLKSVSGTSAIISPVEMRLEPVNIPTQYKLMGFTSNAQNTTFSYSTSEQSSKFVISASPELSGETFTAKAAGVDICQPALQASFLPISWNTNINGRFYKITITGNISKEELQKLANTIEFKETSAEN